MKKKALLSLAALVILAASLFTYLTFDKKEAVPAFSINKEGAEKYEPVEDPRYENPEERLEYELSMLVDPATGQLPTRIKQRELAFAKATLNADRLNQNGINPPRMAAAGSSASENDGEWENVGPYNVGGRTRALAIDVNDDNTILAGGVSGGVWKTTDLGQSWRRTTALEDHPSVTDIVQDERDGRTSEWYYGTGEQAGNSASASGATYVGNGIYKSTDNGENWSLIQATALDGTTSTSGINGSVNGQEEFSLVHELAIDFSNSTGTEIYAATEGQIIRSEDGFETWEVVLGQSNSKADWTDVLVTSSGKVYATIANIQVNSGDKGFFQSDDGITWTQIDLPAAFESRYNRIEMALDPNDENRVWLVAAENLYAYDGSTDTFEDYSSFLSLGNDSGANHNLQGGYNLHIHVKPGDSDYIFIGSTNLFRTSDGYGNIANQKHVGGYRPDSNPNSFPLYPGHHPDNHTFDFLSENPDISISGTDGGVSITQDNTAENGTLPLVWESLNNGYLTSQFYHADIHDFDIADPQVMGGLQDNGTWATFESDPTGDWSDVFGGDGAYNAITYNSLVVSSQNGNVLRFELDENDTYQFGGNISPTSNDGDFLFINPFTYNPVNQDQFFIAARGRVFGNNNVRTNPRNGQWYELSDVPGLTNNFVSSLDVSLEPEGVLYFGTRGRSLYKVADVRNADETTEIIDVTGSNFSVGNISAIAIDPTDADKVLISFSNYGVESVFYTEDGGENWTAVSGNLEENPGGAGAGPSVRAVEILPDGEGGFRYFAGTSVGLFMTTELNGDNTVWTQQAANVLGNVVVSALKVRPIDGKLMASTHGNGVFMGTYDPVGIIPNINYSWNDDFTEATIRGNIAYLTPNPLSYEWLKDGEVIEGETEDQLVASDGGTYQLRLTHTNLGTALSNSVTFSLDGQGPEISSITRLDPTGEEVSGSTVQFQVTFNEEVVNVSNADFETNGDAAGSISSVVESTTGTVFDVTVDNIGGSGTLGLGVASSNNIQDLVGNDFSGTITASETYTVQDTQAPGVSVSRSNPTDAITDQNEVTFFVTFTEQVVNVDVTDIALTSGSPTATLGAINEEETGRVFSVVVTEILDDGVLGLEFTSGQDIADLAGNAFDGTIESNETYTIENVISSIDEELLLNVGEIIVDANPSNGLFNVAFPNAFIGDFQMQIVDGNGRKVEARDVRGYSSGDQVEIDLRSAPDGLYILNVANNKGRGSVKLLKSTSR